MFASYLKKSARGSFTIEAAVIVSLTLMIMFTAIIMSFYIHDKEVMGTSGILAVIRNVPCKGSDEEDDALGIMKDAADTSLLADTIMTGNLSANVSEGLNSYTVTSSGNFSWINTGISQFTGSDMDYPQATVKISNLNGREILLKYKIAKDLLDKE